MDKIKNMWIKRRNLNNHKTWNGDDPSPAFPYDQLESEPNFNKLIFSKNNWNDIAIADFRNVLTDLLYHNRINEKLDQSKFKIIEHTDLPFVFLKSKTITIVASIDYSIEQSQFTIHIKEMNPISVSWYKNRGRIDSIIDTEYGNPINLNQMTDILIELGLETEIESPRSFE